MANFKKGKNIVNSLLFFIITLASCTSPLISEKEFPAQNWKNDPNGCHGTRKELFKKLESNKDKLIGESENSIRKFLGKPDMTELYKRHQKFYIYYLTSGTQCDPEQALNGEKVLFRFNSLNQLNEISWHQAQSK